ncbi:MAG: hypothetical protein KJ043_15150 [Anaerolineae bacterium]|nr:hypothetical protein [Anaerolineae bacterium]
MTQITDVSQPLITSPPPPTHYLHSHITAPHTPPDCPPALITPTYCGELSGAISGGVHCFGYLTLGSHLVYLNMGGPRMAVEAIRARLSRGEGIHLTPEDGDPITFEVNGMGKFEDYAENMSQHHFQNTLLIHRNMTPNYREKDKLTFAFIMAQSPKQVYHAFHQHLHKLLGIAVFPHWIPTLWATGLSADIILKCDGVGAGGYGVYLKWEDWQSIIAIGVSTGVLPLSETGETAQTVTIIDRTHLQLEASMTDNEVAPPETAQDTNIGHDSIYDLLRTHFTGLSSNAILDMVLKIRPLIAEHDLDLVRKSRARQIEMATTFLYYFQDELGDAYTRPELQRVADGLVKIGLSDEFSPTVDYPPSMDTDGKRALYRMLQDETTVLQLHEHIMDIRADSWRGNMFKERTIKAVVSQYTTRLYAKTQVLPEDVFWVIKTHEEY